MVKTLNEDEFEVGVPYKVEVGAHEPHIILYGNRGWTDEVEGATLELLVKAGVVRFVRAIEGENFQTLIYVSNEGVPPREKNTQD